MTNDDQDKFDELKEQIAKLTEDKKKHDEDVKKQAERDRELRHKADVLARELDEMQRNTTRGAELREQKAKESSLKSSVHNPDRMDVDSESKGSERGQPTGEFAKNKNRGSDSIYDMGVFGRDPPGRRPDSVEPKKKKRHHKGGNNKPALDLAFSGRVAKPRPKPLAQVSEVSMTAPDGNQGDLKGVNIVNSSRGGGPQSDFIAPVAGEVEGLHAGSMHPSNITALGQHLQKVAPDESFNVMIWPQQVGYRESHESRERRKKTRGKITIDLRARQKQLRLEPGQSGSKGPGASKDEAVETPREAVDLTNDDLEENLESGCESCFMPDHHIRECLVPAASGAIEGCPLCNVSAHEARNCDKFRNMSLQRKFAYFVKGRAGLVSFNVDWVAILAQHLALDGKDFVEPLPWSQDFGREIFGDGGRYNTIDKMRQEGQQSKIPSDPATATLEAVCKLWPGMAWPKAVLDDISLVAEMSSMGRPLLPEENMDSE